MSETGRKHITIRYVQVPLTFDADEQAHGTTLMAVPDETSVQIHDVNQIGTSYFATLSLVSETPMSQEELDDLESQVEREQAMEQAADEQAMEAKTKVELAPATSIEEHRANRAKRKKKPGVPPPTSG